MITDRFCSEGLEPDSVEDSVHRYELRRRTGEEREGVGREGRVRSEREKKDRRGKKKDGEGKKERRRADEEREKKDRRRGIEWRAKGGRKIRTGNDDMINQIKTQLSPMINTPTYH